MTVVVVTVALAAGALLALGWLVQRPMLYLAGGGTPEAPSGVEEVALPTEDGLELGAWWVPAGDPRATAIVFPGNAGTRALREPLGRTLADLGVNALLVDYRGYAGNPGRPTEAGLRRDALAARQWVDEHGAAPDEVVYVGASLGAAVAAGLASERPPAGLLLRSPFPSLADAAAAAYGLPGWPAWTLPDRYPVAEQVAGLDDVAVVVVAGDDDRIVPARLSVEVAEAAGVDAIRVDGADHNDPRWLDGDPIREAIEQLLRHADLA